MVIVKEEILIETPKIGACRLHNEG